MMAKMLYWPALARPLDGGQACALVFFGQDEREMATVSIDADIKAKWSQGQCSYSPGSPEELAIIGIDLLVKELGTAGAMAFIGQVFEKYPSDYQGTHHEQGLFQPTQPRS
jgi:hypothetical protein